MSEHVKPGELLGQWEVIFEYPDDETIVYQNNGIHQMLLLRPEKAIVSVTPNHQYIIKQRSEYYTMVWFDPPIPNGEIVTIKLSDQPA